MDNRRKFPRTPLVTMARITPHGLQATSEAQIRDISAEGIGVSAKGRYQPGDLLLLKVSIVTTEGRTVRESLTGRVVWVKRSEEEERSAIGIRLSDTERKHPELQAYLLSAREGDIVSPSKE